MIFRKSLKNTVLSHLRHGAQDIKCVQPSSSTLIGPGQYRKVWEGVVQRQRMLVRVKVQPEGCTQPHIMIFLEIHAWRPR